MECATFGCTGQVPKAYLRTHRINAWQLCGQCRMLVLQRNLPRPGFIPSGALKIIAKALLAHVEPSPEAISKAIQMCRGTRHRTGNWDDRPAYRLPPLKYGRAKQRLPHLLVGRRDVPNAKTIAAAFAHYALATNLIQAGEPYARYLAGATFMNRRGLCPPPGRRSEVSLGDAKSPRWLIPGKDFLVLGTHVLNASAVLGMDRYDSDLQIYCLNQYIRGVDNGAMHPPVFVPKWSVPSAMPGDHPLDHLIGKRADVPPQYINATRRASGLIKGDYPIGLDPRPVWMPSKPTLQPTPVRPATPDTAWLFELT